MSTLQTINVKHPSSASNNIVLDSSGNATIASNATIGGNATIAGSMVAASSYAWRNRIINGDMRIDQRNNGAAISVSTDANPRAFAVDRFFEAASGGGVYSAQRSTIAPSGFTNSLALTVTTADASIAAGDVYYACQIIEGFNTADLAWGTSAAQAVTLSFWVRSSVTGTFTGAFRNGAASRSYVFTYTISAANTFEYKTVSISGDTTGTWATDNSGGILINWDLGSGTNFNGTAGAWTTGNFLRSSAGTNWIATNGATWYVTGVQLEVGTVATPFERRDYGRELIMCQRYYVRTPDAERALKRAYNWSGTVVAINVAADFPVTMRAVPTMSVFGDISDGAQISLGAAGLPATIYTFTAYTNVSNGQFLDLHYYIASAEL